MLSDAEILQRYVRERDERAFGELVQRHLSVVYGAALRRTGGRVHLAEEIAQKVFTDLARKAPSLCHHPVLIGWLHRSTRFAAIDAVRTEQRVQKLAQSFAAMPDINAAADSPVEWERLRPVLDAALDQLKESDREVMLLRYFEGLSFAEVGARMHLTENAARMRTERALGKLRVHLEKSGVASTPAALGLLLGNHAFAAAPAGLTASVTSAALTGAPAAGDLITYLLMSKITTPAISALLAAGLTALVWTAVVPGVSAEELATLRAENAKLTQATAADAPAESVAVIANEYAAQATAIAQAMAERQAARAGDPAATLAKVTPRGHYNHGNATAVDAAMSFAWAGDIGDPDEIAKLVYFDPNAREMALTVWAGMPETIRTQYPTPEALYGLLLAASQLEAPPPGADLMEKHMTMVELKPGRDAWRRIGSDRNFHEYQLTEDGWKYVMPEAGVKGLAGILNSQTLAKLTKH